MGKQYEGVTTISVYLPKLRLYYPTKILCTVKPVISGSVTSKSPHITMRS